jgi:hypothetical protein
MWVRAVVVAAAVTVACCAVTAQAAQYKETWNPPEAAHAAKRGKLHASARAPVSKKVAVKGGAAGKSKRKRQNVTPKTAATVHAAHQAKPHAGHQGTPRASHQATPHAKLASKGGSAKSTHARAVKMARSKGAPNKALKTAHSDSGHVQKAAMHPKAQKLAAKPASPRQAHTIASATPSPASLQPAATIATAAAKPAAQGGDLPPLLH